jgi:hypothetical protein
MNSTSCWKLGERWTDDDLAELGATRNESVCAIVLAIRTRKLAYKSRPGKILTSDVHLPSDVV